MEQNKMPCLFIARRLKPTVNQVFSLREKLNKLQAICMLTATKSLQGTKQMDDILLTVDFNLRNVHNCDILSF